MNMCAVLTVPAVLGPAACCSGPSEFSALYSARLLSDPPSRLLWTASAASGPKLHPESFQHLAVSEGREEINLKTH